MKIPTLFHEIEWRHARAWVGRRLVLKEPWLDFEAGTPCRVMCIVDFGDELLFWIKTDDDAQRDVDQVNRRELEMYFRVEGHMPATNRSVTKRPPTQQKAPRQRRRTTALRPLTGES